MKKFIGDRAFYKSVLAVFIPIVIQNAITNFVSLLDNIMVGQIGTEQMSGVAIINQLIFIYNLALFGAVSGPGIFTAQYVGQKNDEGIRETVRIKLIMVVIIALAGIAVLLGFDKELISLYLTDSGQGLDLELTLQHAQAYLKVMLVGLVPFAINQAYAGTLRECGETKVPMRAGLIAVLVNLIFNYILIFGHFGAPKLGVTGAAIATVISRFVEVGIVIVWTHTHPEKAAFAKGLYKGFHISGNLAGKVLVKGSPLFLNEFLWSVGMSALTQCYSTRGLEVIAAFNISNTIVNLFNVAFIAMGSTVAIMIGQILGSGKLDDVVDTDNKLIAFSMSISAVLALMLIILAPLFPRFYNTQDSIRDLSVILMRCAAVFMPCSAFLNTAYFTLRSGGKTFITFLFDSGFVCLICFPVAYVLAHFTTLTIVPLYICVLCLDLLKALIGFILLKKRIWIQDLVA